MDFGESLNLASMRSKEVDSVLSISVEQLKFSLNKFEEKADQINSAMISLKAIKTDLESKIKDKSIISNEEAKEGLDLQLADCVSDRRAAKMLLVQLREEIEFLRKVIKFKTEIVT